LSAGRRGQDEDGGGFVASSAFGDGEYLTTAHVSPAASAITQGTKTATPSRPRTVFTTLVE
jgi:hypothetical protein